MIKYYGYNQCGTCRKAKSYLASKKISFTEIDITTNPPPRSVLEAILEQGDYTLPELFNRSGEMYRSLKIKEKIKTTPESKLLDLLSKNGKLIKRPIVTDGKRATVGFDEARMKTTWS
tara:strand:+ start:213 stop:566 length:354 start_codon:yes stop_codon:yes gene_type:complete